MPGKNSEPKKFEYVYLYIFSCTQGRVGARDKMVTWGRLKNMMFKF